MIRAIAIISCFIATLFLVPVQGECNEISEHESETECELCVIVDRTSLSEITDDHNELLFPSGITRDHVFATVKSQDRKFHLPTRILNCVFRE